MSVSKILAVAYHCIVSSKPDDPSKPKSGDERMRNEGGS